MAATDKSVSRRAGNDSTPDVGEILSKRFVGVNLYVVIMLVLAVLIIGTGVKAAEQVQKYHQDYKVLQDMRKQYRKLQVEHQRLLIEQQTFSATPQIASRAVAELGMFSPGTKDKLILQPGSEPADIPADIATGNKSSAASNTPATPIPTDATSDQTDSASAATEVTP